MVYRWEKTPSKKSAMSVVKMAMKSNRLWDKVRNTVRTVIVGNRLFMVERLQKMDPLWRVVPVMTPRVQSLLKLVSLREMAEGRRNRVVLVMVPSVQSLPRLVSLREIAYGRRNRLMTSSMLVLVMFASVRTSVRWVSLRQGGGRTN